MDVNGTKEQAVSGFGYIGYTCIVFMGFVVHKKNIEYLPFVSLWFSGRLRRERCGVQAVIPPLVG